MDVSILHLDDSPDDLWIVRQQLLSKEPSWRLISVSNRAAFEKALATDRFDVVLSDYRMPEWNGDQVLAFVLERYPHIPVIMLTGELGEERAVETLTRGATDYVMKSNLLRLVPAVERALREAANADARRRALSALREREEYYRVLFEGSSLPKWIFDQETLEILDVNPAALETLGYGREEVLSMRVLALWSEEDRSLFRDHLDRLRESQRERFQASYRRKDGSCFKASAHWSALDLRGRRTCLATVTDVTELVALRDELARELEDMKRLHDLSRRLLEGTNTDGMLRDVLVACIDLMGAQKGNVQLYDDAVQALTIRTQVGFGSEFLEYFRLVPVGRDCGCGQALERRERIVVEDAFESMDYKELREPYRRENLKACISTPLLGCDGRLYGMLNVHFKERRRPTDYELRLLDLYVVQAGRVLELRNATC